MYSVVLAAVLTTGGAAPDCWFGSWSSCHGCYSSCHGCYSSCHGCYSSCSGWSSCHGCYSSCHGCYSSCYGSCYSSCYGSCSSSCYGSCYGSWSTPSVPVSGDPQMPVIGQSSSSMMPASVVIKAPTGVKVKVNGQATAMDSVEQRFRTPAIQAGQIYSYEVVATTSIDGKEFSQTRKVIVRAGQESRVDFSDITVAAKQQQKSDETVQKRASSIPPLTAR